MKTVCINTYKFNELSDKAKNKAINSFRDRQYDYQHYYDEITSSVKALVELFNLKTGRQYSDLKTSHIDDNITELKGLRLYKYLMSNYYNDLFTPKYLKSIDRELKCRQFICKVNKDYKGEKYTMLYSRLFRSDCCVLTGVCYDNDILQPVYDFLKKPDKHTTFEDLIQDIAHAISKAYASTEEWISSDDFIRDEIEANDYDFTEEGKLY